MRQLAKRVSAAGLVVGVLGCGGGGASNDGGVGVTLTGFNPVENGTCQAGTLISIATLPISGGASAEGPRGTAGAQSCLQVQNNMVTQAVRLDRAFIRFFVAGSSVQPPATATGLGAFLPAATGPTSLPDGGIVSPGQTQPGVQPGSKPQGTLPSGAEGAGASSVSVSFSVVPAPIAEWILTHRNELPQPPFEMITSVQASGITSAGDRIETNEMVLTVVVTEDNLF